MADDDTIDFDLVDEPEAKLRNLGHPVHAEAAFSAPAQLAKRAGFSVSRIGGPAKPWPWSIS